MVAKLFKKSVGDIFRPDHNTGNSVPNAVIEMLCGIFNVPQSL